MEILNKCELEDIEEKLCVLGMDFNNYQYDATFIGVDNVFSYLIRWQKLIIERQELILQKLDIVKKRQ